jgi:hypothetical protein
MKSLFCSDLPVCCFFHFKNRISMFGGDDLVHTSIFNSFVKLRMLIIIFLEISLATERKASQAKKAEDGLTSRAEIPAPAVDDRPLIASARDGSRREDCQRARDGSRIEASDLISPPKSRPRGDPRSFPSFISNWACCWPACYMGWTWRVC